LDFSPSRRYREASQEGAFWLSRASTWKPGALALPEAKVLIATAEDGLQAALAAQDLSAWGLKASVAVLSGGQEAWMAKGLPSRPGRDFLTEPQDVWEMPYMDPQAPREAQEAYFEWERGLTAQLAREPRGGFKAWPRGPRPTAF
jgi:rhodanese-related sulfurtransferase